MTTRCQRCHELRAPIVELEPRLLNPLSCDDVVGFGGEALLLLRLAATASSEGTWTASEPSTAPVQPARS